MAKNYDYKMTRACALCGVAMWAWVGAPMLAVCRPCCRVHPKLGPPRPPVPRIHGTCAQCGRGYVGTGRTYCSAACSQEDEREKWADYVSTSRPKGRFHRHVRRRLLAAIVERDGNKCGICHKRVDLTLSGLDKRGPTIDHVLPASDDGTDDLANLRLTHMICNAARGNRGGPEQLALVG